MIQFAQVGADRLATSPRTMDLAEVDSRQLIRRCTCIGAERSGLSIEQVSLAAIRYVIVLILLMLVVAYVPEISLFLPHLLS